MLHYELTRNCTPHCGVVTINRRNAIGGNKVWGSSLEKGRESIVRHFRRFGMDTKWSLVVVREVIRAFDEDVKLAEVGKLGLRISAPLTAFGDGGVGICRDKEEAQIQEKMKSK